MTRDRYLELAATPAFTVGDLDDLLESGDLIECPHCHGLNAYSWHIAAFIDPDDDTADPVARPGIAHIPRCSGREWQCGHCLTDWTTADSPLTHPCYTHAED